MDDIEQAIENQRAWLARHLKVAAGKLGVLPHGEVVNTYDIRSAGSVATEPNGDKVWLRVVFENPIYQPALRWDGNIEANSITGVPKPEVLRWVDWINDEPHRNGCRMRGEVSTLAPGATVAPDGQLAREAGLPETWWVDLHAALTRLARQPAPPTEALNTASYTIRGVHEHFGVQLAEAAFAELEWSTAHFDLHWGNITGPELCILDWESWRSAPSGYDAATLYCNSLRAPKTAQLIRLVFNEVLNTHTGRIATIYAVVRYLHLVGEGGSWDDMGDTLRDVGQQVLKELRP